MSIFITEEEKKEIKKIDLYTYLSNYEPDNLVKVSRNVYRTKDHESIKISNGMWTWWTHNIGGRSALDYLIKVRNYSFLDAANHIKELINTTPPIIEKTVPKEFVPFTPPKKYKNYDIVCKYLMERCIDKNIIVYCIYQELLYESTNHHNLVFTGKDINGEIKYASIRGTKKNNKFHGDVSGSDKRFSFSLTLNPAITTIHIFECPIDLLSYATILKEQGIDWKKKNYLSLAGVYHGKENATPLALDEYLKNHPYIKTIVTHLDNDKVGHEATKFIIDSYSNDYLVVDKTPKIGNDVNENLCLMVNKNTTRSNQYAR